jgi:glyoxylase-like metal-dependent hydrolase (beta-lactamase superfamily II)
MREVLPEIFHWTAFHERIRKPVSSLYVADAATLIDPMLPDEGLEWFADNPPKRILLSNRLHYRKSASFVEAFGCRVFCHEAGLGHFAAGAVEPFAFGEVVAPQITAYEVGSICPEDTCFFIDSGEGALAFADGLISTTDGALGFVPDGLMGDDPEAVRRGVRDSLAKLLGLQFDYLFFAHGPPIEGGGKQALRAFSQATLS